MTPIKDPFRYVLAASAANGLAFIIPNTSPFIVGGLIDGFPMSEESAGLVLTVELSAMGMAALAIAPLMGKVSRRPLAYVALLIAAAANGLAATHYVSGFMLLLLVRAAAGLGAGLLLAAANAAIAGSLLPSRLYGFTLMVGWFAAACLGPAMAFAVSRWGYSGGYGVWMLLALMALSMVGGIGVQQSTPSTATKCEKRETGAGVVHIIGIALVGLAMMAYFAYVERLGRHAGFSLAQVGILFAAISCTGAVGAGLAGLTGDRHGLFVPLILGTALHAVAILVAVLADNQTLFVIGAAGEGLTYMYLLAYQLAVAARLDRSGRWAAAASGAMIASTGIGPYVGGALIAANGFAALGVLNVITAVIAVAAFVWVLRQLRVRPSS